MTRFAISALTLLLLAGCANTEQAVGPPPPDPQTQMAPLALRDLGMKEADIDRAADLAVQDPYWNPRPIERPAIRELLGRAWAGLTPKLPPEIPHG